MSLYLRILRQWTHPGVDAIEPSEHDHDVEEDEREADRHQDGVVKDRLPSHIWKSRIRIGQQPRPRD